VAAPLGLSLHAAAWGIHTVANANMERAMRVVSIERGRDPRRYSLVAFGGAGPLHAARLARALGIPRVIVPRGAGVGSALGLLFAAPKVDIGLTRVLRLDGTAHDAIAAIFADLEARVTADARRIREVGRIVLRRSASMHHVGQGYEIRVDLPDGPVDAAFEAAARTAFYARYKQEYGYIDRESALEVTDWYVVASIVSDSVEPPALLQGEARGSDPVIGSRQAWFPETGGMTECQVIDRYALHPGTSISGPALVEERESTTVVLPGDTLRLSELGNLIIEIGGTR
jgi:N-methylhydantoinase A